MLRVRARPVARRTGRLPCARTCRSGERRFVIWLTGMIRGCPGGLRGRPMRRAAPDRTMADHIDRVPGTARSPACPEPAPAAVRRNRRWRRDRPARGVHRMRCRRPAGSAFGRRECRPGARSRSDGAAVESHDRGPVRRSMSSGRHAVAGFGSTAGTGPPTVRGRPDHTSGRRRAASPGRRSVERGIAHLVEPPRQRLADPPLAGVLRALARAPRPREGAAAERELPRLPALERGGDVEPGPA